MENIEWIFNGIGTAIVTFVFGFIFGGGVGYKIAIKNKNTGQKQKAGDYANQTQVGEIKND